MRFVLQRGHVPRRTGSVGTAGEQQLVTRIAAKVVALAPAGLDVVVIDADEPSGRYRGDAFVALHADGSSNPNVGGASIGYRTPEGRDLGEAWKNRYRANGWPGKFRGDNYTRALSGYYGTRVAELVGTRRAVIVEHGFLTNPTERAWMISDVGITAAARAAIEAVTGQSMSVEDEQEDDEMRQGSPREGDVRKLQTRLNNVAKGVGFPRLSVDGDFGPKTKAAVEAFQRAQGLTVDGVVSMATAEQLWALAHGVGSHA